jgi:hypothetical protein
MTPPSSTLRQAADLQERIEQLQHELDALLQQTGEAADDATRRPEGQKQPVTPPPERRGKAVVATPAARGRGRRRGSPSGPLAPAVVQVLKAKGAPRWAWPRSWRVCGPMVTDTPRPTPRRIWARGSTD